MGYSIAVRRYLAVGKTRAICISTYNKAPRAKICVRSIVDAALHLVQREMWTQAPIRIVVESEKLPQSDPTNAQGTVHFTSGFRPIPDSELAHVNESSVARELEAPPEVFPVEATDMFLR